MTSFRRQRGIAFVIVLWVMALLAVLLGSFVVVARTENLQTRHLFDGTRARYAAEAGLARAVYELRRADPQTRWVADGRPYELTFEDATIRLEIVDETGKLDINGADEQTLIALFRTVGGVEEDRAIRLADAVIDWRDADDLVRPFGAEDRDYEAEGYEYGAADANFVLVGELQQVMGMDYELFRKLESHVTVYGFAARPNPAFASELLLQTLPGITPDLAAQLIEQRRQFRPGDPAAAGLTLPDGTPLVAGSGSATYTVKSRATLPNGMWTVIDTTIRLGGSPGGRAYGVLRWREGSAD